MLDKLRTEQASISIVNDRESHKGILESNREGATEISQAYTSEVVSLKVSNLLNSIYVLRYIIFIYGNMYQWAGDPLVVEDALSSHVCLDRTN